MLVLGWCLIAAWAYGRGVRRVWSHAGHGRGVRQWQAWCFGTGLVSLGLALESPLDAWAADLFAAHMAQHLVLLLVVAPLLVLGAPLAPLAWALPEDTRQQLTALKHVKPVAKMPQALVLHSLALWVWHIPAAYDAAIANPVLHVAEHLSFLSTAVLFWWALLGSGRTGYGAGVLYVFGMGLQSTLLGALLTFGSAPWYTAHLTTTAAWGLSPSEDQQLAGLIMWIGGGALYLAAALAMFAAWLNESDRTPDPAAHTPAHQ